MVQAEIHSLPTHSSNIYIWLEECRKFNDHRQARGYPARAIDATFSKVSWNQRSKLLEPNVTSKAGDVKITSKERCQSYSRGTNKRGASPNSDTSLEGVKTLPRTGAVPLCPWMF